MSYASASSMDAVAGPGSQPQDSAAQGGQQMREKSGGAEEAEEESQPQGDAALLKLALLACGEPQTAPVISRLQSMAAMVERHLRRNASQRDMLRCLCTTLYEYYHLTVRLSVICKLAGP